MGNCKGGRKPNVIYAVPYTEKKEGESEIYRAPKVAQ